MVVSGCSDWLKGEASLGYLLSLTTNYFFKNSDHNKYIVQQSIIQERNSIFIFPPDDVNVLCSLFLWLSWWTFLGGRDLIMSNCLRTVLIKCAVVWGNGQYGKWLKWFDTQCHIIGSSALPEETHLAVKETFFVSFRHQNSAKGTKQGQWLGLQCQ